LVTIDADLATELLARLSSLQGDFSGVAFAFMRLIAAPASPNRGND